MMGNIKTEKLECVDDLATTLGQGTRGGNIGHLNGARKKLTGKYN